MKLFGMVFQIVYVSSSYVLGGGALCMELLTKQVRICNVFVTL